MFFAMCLLASLSTTIQQLFQSQKCQHMGRMCIKKKGQGPGLIKNKASLRIIRKLSSILICFDGVRSLHLKISVIISSPEPKAHR